MKGPNSRPTLVRIDILIYFVIDTINFYRELTEM